MDKIRNILKNHPDTKFNLLPTLIYTYKDIPANTQISSSFERLRIKYFLGTQYELLARLANHLNENLEVGVTFDPRGKIARTIYGEGATAKKSTKSHVFDYLDVDFINASADLKAIFMHLKMPVSLFHITKPIEYQRMCDMGLKNVADATWFCHNPIMGMTCGCCNPCRDALHEGMAWRVSKIGHILGLTRAIPTIFRNKILHKY